LKTSYSNSGFVTTPYEHLFEKEQPKTIEKQMPDAQTRSLSQSISEGFKQRGEIEGMSVLILDRELESLVRLRDRQRNDYEAKIEALRREVLDKNKTIAALKAQIIHFKTCQK
jgi:hypothetical protein